MIAELGTEALVQLCDTLFLDRAKRMHVRRLARASLRSGFRVDKSVRTEGEAAVWCCLLAEDGTEVFPKSADMLHEAAISYFATASEFRHDETALSKSSRRKLREWLLRWMSHADEQSPDDPIASSGSVAEASSDTDSATPLAEKPAKRRKRPRDIRNKAWEKLFKALKDETPITSKNQLARMVGCSPNADSLCSVWNEYQSKYGSCGHAPRAEPMHDGLGEDDVALERLRADEIEKLKKEQTADMQRDRYPRRAMV